MRNKCGYMLNDHSTTGAEEELRTSMKVESATGLPREFVAAVILISSAVYVAYANWSPVFCTVVGLIYPLYRSVAAIETSAGDAERTWLTYWIVHALFSVVETTANPVLDQVPGYWFLKCAFLMCLFAPVTRNGSFFIYHRCVSPVYRWLSSWLE
ncbi:unnamed protein product [Notodromas monacha]|uniref:Receptor expression-enhancing protein n=1 Tax=Notodromas monacha TaxID=399045 RepID=A0A7R9BHG3_9CRUS|nr:unnamed protein product [Notodromas monacha]CAG0915538.1 unnamed protein product [Notodromas monacha]